MIRAAVLCGGKGTRLRGMIGPHQKCAVDVGGRHWIHRVMDFLQAGGVEQCFLLTGYQAKEVEAAALAWERTGGMAWSCLRSKPSGAEAAVRVAFARTQARSLLVVNGDTLVEGFDLRIFAHDCEARRLSGDRRGASVIGPSAMRPFEIAQSGIYFRCVGGTPTPVPWPATIPWPTTIPFLDIGSPDGLALARDRFGRPDDGHR